mgnify:CR=1 FL=1
MQKDYETFVEKLEIGIYEATGIPRENISFERCVDVVTVLILKYGPAIKRKWILREWIKNNRLTAFGEV